MGEFKGRWVGDIDTTRSSQGCAETQGLRVQGHLTAMRTSARKRDGAGVHYEKKGKEKRTTTTTVKGKGNKGWEYRIRRE